MTLSVNITRRGRKRKQRSGATIVQPRFVLNYRDPRTGQRHQLFFERKKDAETRRDALVADYQLGTSLSPQRASVTVSEIVERWLAHRHGQIRDRTLRAYKTVVPCIVGPLIRGTPDERRAYTLAVRKPVSVEFLPMLGHLKVKDLTTAAIRDWHRMLWQEVGPYTANRARAFLKTALALAAEDFDFRPPAMPAHLGLRRTKIKKVILNPEQVSALLGAARADTERGIYVAFPFLAGTRPSEQLGLLWSEVDFDKDEIRIRRSQTDRGELVETTKTEAGTREIPMGAALRQMLLEWRVRCPRVAGELYRVFPGLGRPQAWPKPRLGAGGALEYHNYRSRIWRPFFDKLELPYVTPHSARHTFISTMQLQGVEVGLVAKIAGHANPNVTLGHYTQAVRGGAEAAAALEKAYLPG
jgi:integrase